MWVVTVSDCYWSWVFTCFTHFCFFWWIFAKLKTKVNIGSCLLSGWGFIVFQGGFSLMYFLKCNQIVTMSAKRFSFLFFFSILSFFNNSSQAFFFLATLTDSEREIFYFVSWNVGHWFFLSFSREQHDFLLMSRWFSPYI